MQRRDRWLIAISIGLVCLAAGVQGKEPESKTGRLSIHDRPPRKVYRYSESEDRGIFWSNDPKATIGEMAVSLGLLDAVTEQQERAREAQDRLRGGIVK